MHTNTLLCIVYVWLPDTETSRRLNYYTGNTQHQLTHYNVNVVRLNFSPANSNTAEQALLLSLSNLIVI